MVEFFNFFGKLYFSIEPLTFETSTLANIKAFSLTIAVGISVSWQALDVSSFKMSLKISSVFIFEKKKQSFRFLL